MRITDDQMSIINQYKCERLSSNPDNQKEIQLFYSKKGENLVKYLKEMAWEEDITGKTAFYLIRTPQGKPVVFFALKSGALFTPLNEERMKEEVEFASTVIRLLHESSEDDPKRQELIESLRNNRNVALDQIIANVTEVAKKRKTTLQNALQMLENDLVREGNKNIFRVGQTFSGVEMTHFCTDDNEKSVWKEYGFNYPLGEVMFWTKIVPIITGIQDSIGCQYVFLFAADESPDGDLTNYYNVELKFQKLQDVGTSKPYYDFCCEFMSQEINELRNNQEAFLNRFNPDLEDIIV